MEKEELKKIAEQDLIEGRSIIDKMKAKRDQMFEFDRGFEKNFKKEFPGLGFNQLEALMKCFKKRPKGVAVAVEQHLALMSGKDMRAKHDSMSNISYSAKPGKDLKAKSIAAALERVSEQFQGTFINDISLIFQIFDPLPLIWRRSLQKILLKKKSFEQNSLINDLKFLLI